MLKCELCGKEGVYYSKGLNKYFCSKECFIDYATQNCLLYIIKSPKDILCRCGKEIVYKDDKVYVLHNIGFYHDKDCVLKMELEPI